MQDLRKVFETRRALRMQWASASDVATRQALRDALDQVEEQLRGLTMYHVPRSIRLQMLDIAHQSRDRRTGSIARIIGVQFGVTPSRRTVRRWMTDETCRNELCPCQAGALFNEAPPFEFDGADAVEWAEYLRAAS